MKRFMSLLSLTLALLLALAGCSAPKKSDSGHNATRLGNGSKTLTIVSGSENKELEPLIESYAKKNNLTIEMHYKGSVDIMRELQAGTSDYDAVWPASSMWIQLGDATHHKVKHVKSTTITPVVFGVKKSLAHKLKLTDGDVTLNEIITLIQDGKLRFAMTSATQSNSGASAYFGFLNALSGNPEVLESSHLHDPQLKKQITALLSGVDRSSGSSEWLKTLFLNGDYDAMVNYESLIITTNQELVARGKEPLYAIYPKDAVSLADSPLGYIDNGNTQTEEIFTAFQDYIKSPAAQNELQKLGRRTSVNGVNPENQHVFKAEWGINTTKVLSPITMPKAEVINEALNMYQSEFRKPSYTVYCMDFSGSMSGTGEKQVKEAMDMILDQKRAAPLLIQANSHDVNEAILFNHDIMATYKATDGSQASLNALNRSIQSAQATGGTNMYTCLERAFQTLKNQDTSTYNTAVVLMTDGKSDGSYNQFDTAYRRLGRDVPVYSILFGSADKAQLDPIAQRTNARVFDGRKDLVSAFRTVKGYV